MPGTASIYGLVSGLDTATIISKLMELERVPITRLKQKQTALSTKLTVWQDANTRVLALKVKADLLATSSTFDAKTFVSSDETILTGSASAQAQAGTYYLTVNSLARAHQQATQGYADTTTTSVGTGTISIQIGSGTAKVITVDESNSTLAGLRDAINKAGAGVTASIINDGSGTSPYRLIITSNTGGTAGQVTIQANLTGGTTPTLSTMQAAQDASVTLGEGAGAITVTKGTNQITDLIPGLTLNLQKADPTKVVTVTIQNNTDSIKLAIKDFVDQYNNLMDFMKQQFKYDANSQTAGTLFADSSLQTIEADIAGKLFGAVSGLSQTIVVLSQIGVTSTTSDDKLTIDETKLDEVIAAGLDPIKRLLAAVGEATNSAVSYMSCTDKTKPSGPAGYAVEITAAATQGRVTAGVAQTDALAQDEQLTINGTGVQLTAGMTAAQVVAKINEYTSQTGVIASSTDINGQGTGDYLTLRRVGYGSALTITAVSSVSNGGGTPVQNTSGLGNGEVTQSSYWGEAGTGTGAAGTDVAGTINGEAATGSGYLLTGNEGNANTEGLKIRVTAQTPGSYGLIRITKGLASVLGEYLDFITRPGVGAVKSAQNALQTQIDDIDDDVAALEERVAAKEDRLINQFAAMESALSRLQNQGSFLTSQLQQVANAWKY